MNGPELALRLQSLQPGLITVFMSGYADHDVLHKVMHGAMTAFIQKPFTMDVLLLGVEEALRTPPKVSEAAHLSGFPLGDCNACDEKHLMRHVRAGAVCGLPGYRDAIKARVRAGRCGR
jgi:DNA-binding NtrC family response regulator